VTQEEFWAPVADAVLRDAAATTDLDLTWRFQHRTTELDVPRVPGLTLWFDDAGPGRRELPAPVLELRLPRTWFELPTLDDVTEARLFLADRVQDHVVEELHGAWPVCAGHPHPMRPELVGGEAVWRCPVDVTRVHAVGALPAPH
jgi:hypothetical protein